MEINTIALITMPFGLKLSFISILIFKKYHFYRSKKMFLLNRRHIYLSTEVPTWLLLQLLWFNKYI